MTSLVRTETAGGDDLEALGSRVAELDALLAQQSAEVLRVKAELNAFKATYRDQVGSLHEQLEQLELEIADAELGELAKNAANRASGPREPGAAPAAERAEPLPRFTSDAVRKLFRDVARTIHPDLARDEATKDRRHTLMIEPTGPMPWATKSCCARSSMRGRRALKRSRGAIPRPCGCDWCAGLLNSRNNSRCWPPI